jgi:hypothetical protein
MSEQKDFFSSPDRSAESHQLPNPETDKKIEVTESPVTQESLDIIEQNQPIYSSPAGEASGVVEETLEQFDHAKAVGDKKAEALALEHLLANEDITGSNAFDVMNAAEDLAQSE